MSLGIQFADRLLKRGGSRGCLGEIPCDLNMRGQRCSTKSCVGTRPVKVPKCPKLYVVDIRVVRRIRVGRREHSNLAGLDVLECDPAVATDDLVVSHGTQVVSLDVVNSSSDGGYKQVSNTPGRNGALSPVLPVSSPLAAHDDVADLDQHPAKKYTEQTAVRRFFQGLDSVAKRNDAFSDIAIEDPPSLVPRLDEGLGSCREQLLSAAAIELRSVGHDSDISKQAPYRPVLSQLRLSKVGEVGINFRDNGMDAQELTC